MNPVECIKVCFRKYADFSGRAGRPEFWWFFLFQVIVLTATAWIPVLSSIVTLLLLLPSLAVGARRLHDLDRTGWWLLLALIPFVGWIPLLIMAALPGTGGPNRYGPAPHSANALPPTGAHWPQGGYGGPEHSANALPPTGAHWPQGGGAESGGREYCTQCGAERASGDARACIVCGAGF